MNVTVQRSPKIFWARVGKKLWIFNPDLGELHTIEDQLAVRTWDLCGGRLTASQIIGQLSKLYRLMGRGDVRDTLQLLQNLQAKQLLLVGEQTEECVDNEVLTKRLEKVVDDLKSRKDTLAIFLRGSSAKGFATRLSDVDIGVLTEQAQLNLKSVFRRVGDSVFHIRYHDMKDLRAELRELRQDSIFKSIYELLGYIQNAKILFEKNQALTLFKEETERIHPSSDLVNRYMRMSWGMINDAFSDIERGDMNNAVLNARLASNEALKALVFHKRVYEREKWHYLTVKRRSMLKREYLQLFESIHGLQTASKLQAVKTAMRAAEFAEQIEHATGP